MLTGFLFPIANNIYKTDSNVVATWLANTAQQCGCSKNILENQAASSKRPECLKAERKLARDAAQNKSSHSQRDNLEFKTTPEG
jgi:hypothetical protein